MVNVTPRVAGAAASGAFSGFFEQAATRRRTRASARRDEIMREGNHGS